MSRHARIVSFSLMAALLCPLAARAQYLSELVGFNDDPIDDPATSQEMFRIPEWSGSTSNYVLHNSPDLYDFNAAFRAAGLQTEGVAAMEVFFDWVDPIDPYGWVRLTTFNGPERPNPALHTQGKVRFKITNRSELSQGEIGICLGIRETGAVVPQMDDGGISGDIEWVGVTGVVLDPNDPNVALAPIPAITLPTSPIAYQLEWNLSTGVVSVDGVPQGGTIEGFTGDGVLNAPNNRGTLEHIALVNVTTDLAIFINVAIDELQFEAPEPDPVMPPTVVWPIIAGDTEVIVTDLMTDVEMVFLYLNGDFLQMETVSDPNDVVFTIDPAVTGQIYSAVQSVGGTLSEQSDGVEVLPEPPPYTFSLLVDESGEGSCDPYGTEWEWVGVTSVEVVSGKWEPQGQPVFVSDGLWQAIDVPLDDDDLTLPGPFLGDGQLGDSPTGFYTIDSVWFTLAEPGALGPWEVFIDSVQVIDEFGQPGEVILDMEDGVNRLRYARGQSPDELGLISSQLSATASYDGTTSHRLEWGYDGVPLESIGMLQRVGWTCGTSALIPDTSTAVRFHMVLRGQPTAPDIPLPQVAGPIIVGDQDTVRVLNDPNAVSVQLYLNGDAWGDPGTPTDTYTDFSGLVLEPGHSLSASQTLPAGTSDLAYPRAVTDTTPPPTVSVPIAPGSTSVEVADVLAIPYATASLVEVYVNASPEPSGSAVPGGETVVVSLDVTLVTGDQVTATQTVNGVTSAESEAVTVAYPAPAMYAAPAEGDLNVLVMALNPVADSVTVVVNGTTEFSATPDPGSDRCNVSVSGLVMGDLVTAYYTVGDVDSVESVPETVTNNVSTEIVACDDFESYANQGAMELVWTQGGSVPVELSTEKDATCPDGGAQSAHTPPGNSWMYQPIPQTVPTAADPVVFNVNIYDPVGVDPEGLVAQWVELNHIGGPDWFYMHIGMLGWADTDNVHYDFRANGNGGPNWVDLNEFDAPERSVGWHVFTVVHKGNLIDIYVDGLLARKNLTLTNETTYARMEIGGGDWDNGADVWFDDFCLETGPVRFGCIPEQGCPNPGESGNYCTADIDGSGDCIVALADLAQLLGHYGITSGAVHDDGDLDGDGDVDLADLAELLGQYGDDCN